MFNLKIKHRIWYTSSPLQSSISGGDIRHDLHKELIFALFIPVIGWLLCEGSVQSADWHDIFNSHATLTLH